MVVGLQKKYGLSNMKKNMTYETVRKELLLAIDTTSQQVSRYFKTNPGEYAQDDKFLGIKTPTLRKIAKNFLDLPQGIILQLLHSKYNEERLFALIILVKRYPNSQKKVYELYLENIKCVNNWNLVDISAHHIMGAYLFDKDKAILYKLARAKNLWERRIAIVASWYFIKKQNFKETLLLVEFLLEDKADLLHKACGWMLREVGKQDENVLKAFLERNYRAMPRVMLRYAIERLDDKRKFH